MHIPTSGMYIVDKSLFSSVQYCYILLLYNQVSVIMIHKCIVYPVNAYSTVFLIETTLVFYFKFYHKLVFTGKQHFTLWCIYYDSTTEREISTIV